MEHKTDGGCNGMPVGKQAQYIQSHNYATNFRDAHPIDAEVIEISCDTKLGPVLSQCDLGAMQAVLSYQDDLLEEHATKILEFDGFEYYQTKSEIYYEIASEIKRYYDITVNIDNIAELAEIHTRQYLLDMHGFDGEFDHNPTICDVYNNPETMIDEPDCASYTHIDSRGIVFEQDTH